MMGKSLKENNTPHVDAIWNELKSCCTSLRCAKNITERNKAINRVQTFLSEEQHQLYLHKWRAWGLLFSTFLQAIKADLQPFFMHTNSTNKKRKLKTPTSKPKVELVYYLRSEFAATNAFDEPKLQWDPNGRECLKQIFTFAFNIINQESQEGIEDMILDTRFRSEAWHLINAVVQYKVYCLVIPPEELIEVLEVALAALDERTGHFSSNDFALRAQTVRYILQNAPFDLHGWLDKLLNFINNWFEKIGPTNRSILEAAASLMVQAVNGLIRGYFPAMKSHIRNYGFSVIHYIQRTWRGLPHRLRVYQAEFLTLYVKALMDQIPTMNIKEANKHLKEFKVMSSLFLGTKELHQILLHNRGARSNVGGVSMIGATSVVLDLDITTALCYSAAADVLFYHDQLLEHLRELDSALERNIGKEIVIPPLKRAKKSLLDDPPLRNILLLNVSSISDNDSQLMSPTMLQSSMSQNQSRSSTSRQTLPWLLLMLSFLTRHGRQYILSNEEETVQLLHQMLRILETKEVTQLQITALYVLLIIGASMTIEQKIKHQKVWVCIWKVLLQSDLPYFHSTKTVLITGETSTGFAVISLLSMIVSLKMIPQSKLEKDQKNIWDIVEAGTKCANPCNTANVCVQAIMFLLCGMLNQVGISDEAGTVDRQGHFESTMIGRIPRLLQVIFDYFQLQLISRATDSDKGDVTMKDSSYLKLYTCALLILLGHHNTHEIIWAENFPTPPTIDMVCKYSSDENDTKVNPLEQKSLQGFGVPFLMHEWGIDVFNRFEHGSRESVYNFSDLLNHGRPFEEPSDGERFIPLSIPNVPELSVISVNLSQMIHAQIIAMNGMKSDNLKDVLFPRIAAEEVEKSMSKLSMELLNKLSSQICSLDTSSNGFVSVLLNILDTAIIFATVYGDVGKSNLNSLDISQLVKTALILISDNLHSRTLESALARSMTCESMICFVEKFNLVILLLQGRSKICRLVHPTTDLIDIRISSEHRPAVRKIVGLVESFMQSAAVESANSSSDLSILSQTSQALQQQHSHKISKSFVHARGIQKLASSSGISSTPIDDDDDDDGLMFYSTPGASASGSSTPSISPILKKSQMVSDHLQKILFLWCFRLLVLIKKGSALSTIKTVGSELSFGADFLLALGTVVGGLLSSTPESNEIMDTYLNILNAAQDEIDPIVQQSSKYGHKSILTQFFLHEKFSVISSVLSVLERQKSRSFEICFPEKLKEICKSSFLLIQYMKKAQQDCGICFRVLKCFQINFCQPLFRLDAEHFSEFVDICMESLVDKDAIVQYHAALAIQNLYYMYPNGDVAIFNDIWQCLVPLYPHANQKHDFAFDHLSLVLYVSACSSSSVIPHVLLAFMRTMNISGISSHEWLKLISNCVGYSRLEDMLDDHFSFLWRYWIGLEDKLQDSKTISRSVEDFASYFRSFPIHLFTHTTSPSCKRDFFLKHIHYVYPLCATVDAIVCNAVGQSLVEALELGVVGGAGPNLLLPGIHRELFQEELSLFESKAIEKMLICSDAIFAFVLMLESFCDSVMPNFEDIKHNLLALGCRLNNDCSLISLFVDQHRFTAVLCTLVSFVVEDTGGLGIASDLSNWNLSRMFNEQSILNGVLGSRYLTKAEDQLSQILNINEILVVFRTMICTRCSFQAFFLRGINLFNSFFRMRVDTSLNSLMSCVNGVWSERLLLSTWFDILRWLNLCNARSSNKQISNLLDDQSHALSKCVENLYHLREANDLESFGRNIPFLLNQVIEILSQNTGNDTNPSDLCIHLEGIIYFICNNSANGLGKYIEDAEAYPGNIAPSIDKLRSLAMDNRQNECRHGDKWSSCVEQVEVILEKLNGISSTSTVGRRVTRGRGSKGSTTRIMGVDSGYFSLMFPSLRARLSSLKQHIQKIRILTADHTNDSISNEAKRLITQIATCLFNLNTALKKISHVDDALELMIAECLGEIGALDPLWYNINPGSSLENIRAVSEITHNRGALKDLKGNFMEDMTEDLLKLLCMVLLEPSHTNIPLGSINALRIYAQSLEASHQTIKCLLSQEQVMEILARSKDTDMKEFLNPFYAHSTPTTASQLSKPHFHKEKILWNETTIRDLGWERWICEVGRHLARNIKRQPILAVCDQILLFRKDIALFLFPYLVWSLIRFAGQEDVSYTADNVQNGIRKLITCFKDVESGIPLEVRQSIIHCLNFLREADKMEFIELNIRHQRNGSLAYGLLLDLELLDVAEAAVKTQMPYSAMQYVEMWLEKESGSIRSRCHGQQEERAKRILIEAYDLCDSVDGIYGINDGESYISQLLMYNHEGSYDKALGLSDVLLQFPYGLDIHIPSIKRGMVKSLKSLGYHHLLEGYVTSFESKLGDNLNWLDESKYSLAWKSMQWKQAWNGSSDRSINTDGIRHHEMVFRCLKALAEDDSENLSRLTDTYKRQILNSIEISRRGFETTNPCNRSLLQLQCISEIEEVASYLGNSANASLRLSHQFHMANDLTELPNTALSRSLFEKWCLRHSQIFEDFDQLEDIMSLEEVLVRIGMHTQEQTVMLPQIYLSLATYARKSNRLSVALRNLRILESLSSTNSSISKSDQIMWQIEKAEVLWSQKERRSAIWTAQQVSELICNWLGKSQQLESGERLKLQWLQVKLLTTIGNWLASQRSENSQVIIQDYLMKATNLIDKQLQEQRGNVKHQGYTTTEQVSTAAGAHFALAQYMAEMYHQVNNRIKSREWLAGKRVAKARQQELVECLAMSEAKQVENRAHIHALNREVQYDHEERSKVEASVEEFLTGALESFRKGLILSPRAELAHVFRLLSLWFSNQHNVAVNLVMQNVIDSVPSYKFVPLSYQIISRIGSAINVHGIKDEVIANFQRVLSSLIIKLCEQHPHHSLVQLIALKNSADVEGKGALEFRMNAGDAKAEEAKKYLGRLMRSNQRELLESLDTLCHAYIQLALFDTRDYHKQGKKIPLSKVQVTLFPGNAKGTSGSTRMSNNGVMTTFDQCLRDRSRRSGNNHRSIMPAVMTVSISPRADKDYSNVVRVLSFESTFSITESGIHRPKIIYCYGSDGRRFKQLVKGKDDTRQDLVIEQVFESVNHFLQEDPITSKRNLRLQTYKVVPLSPIAGVLEWVENTIPWGSYLVGRTSKRLSAHERYHPKEWKHTDCRMYLKNATNKYTAYLEIEKNFTPVFHHFFLEKFPDPSMWYHRRLNFVRSVAVSSIVGYILGIGDRHSQNILIHEETAELVHIDFGVVFDQGMALFTPETVPFRLTRDLVDGMGVSGVEGVFTRCCEVTLELMRKKSASLLTILEVFVHDPLYRWTLSPLKALRIQEEGRISNPTNINNESTNKEEENEMNQKSHNDAATRALIRVKQKLEGFEDPNGNALSIEGQVKQLIHSAQDPHNLCHLFPGWAPWL